jgi:pimeloyl-ACP methyl ester carboxylesterase
MADIVVLVPGIMGSRLEHTDAQGRTEEIWPGAPHELWLPYKRFLKLSDPTPGAVKATDVIRTEFLDVYGDFIDYLGTIGFRERDTPPTLVLHPYDWRIDNAVSAGALAATLGRVTSGAPDARIHLVAHSMGGLVCRYYLESAAFSTDAARGNVKSLIAIGTPHRGSPFALSAATGSEKKLFLSARQVQTLANHPAFTALYQLMPVAEPFVWDEGADMQPVDFASLAQKVGLSPANVQAALQFHSQLGDPPGAPGVRYFFFYGTHMQTSTATRLSVTAAGECALDHVLQESAGDGTVPAWSGHVSGVQGYPVGGAHGSLFKDTRLRKMLERVLPIKRMLAAPSVPATMHLLKDVVEPRDDNQLVLELEVASGGLAGLLEVVEVDVDPVTGAVVGEKSLPAARQFAYQGVPMDMLRLQFDAPAVPGAYIVRLQLQTPLLLLLEQTLIVQQP